MSWPGFDAELWQRVCTEPRRPRCASPVIVASDRDAGAVRMAGDNAERAGVSAYVSPLCRSVSALEAPVSACGWVVTNPPYGRRIASGPDLRNLYARLGNVLRRKLGDPAVAVGTWREKILDTATCFAYSSPEGA